MFWARRVPIECRQALRRYARPQSRIAWGYGIVRFHAFKRRPGQKVQCSLSRDDRGGMQSTQVGLRTEHLFVFSREAKDCDLVHIHFSYGVSMTRKALFVRRAKNMGKKVILHSHSSAMERAILEGDSGSKNEIKKFLSLADALIVLSSKWKDLSATSWTSNARSST